MGFLVSTAKRIEQFSTKLASKLALKRVLNMINVSKRNPELAEHWMGATSQRAVQDINERTRRETQAIARYEYLNNPLAAGFAATYALYAIGLGPVLQFRSENKEANQYIERQYKTWCKLYGMSAIDRQIMRCEVIDGESFILLSHNPKRKYAPLSVTTIDPIRVANPNGMPSTAYMRDGVFYDIWGNVEKYCVLNTPENDSTSYNVSSYTMYDVDQVFHVFDPLFPEVSRGMTWYLQSLEDFAHLRDYGLAVITAAKNQASVFSEVSTELGYNDINEINAGEDSGRYDPYTSMIIPRNSLFLPPAKTSFKPIVPTQPMQVYSDYTNTKRTEAAHPMGIPESKAVNSSARYNYSSVQADNQGFYGNVKIIQNRYETQYFDERFRWFYLCAFADAYEKFGDLPMPSEVDGMFRFFWKSPIDVDSLKQAQADAVNIANGTKTRLDICSEQGRDFWDEIAREIEKERKLFPLAMKSNNDWERPNNTDPKPEDQLG